MGKLLRKSLMRILVSLLPVINIAAMVLPLRHTRSSH